MDSDHGGTDTKLESQHVQNPISGDPGASSPSILNYQHQTEPEPTSLLEPNLDDASATNDSGMAIVKETSAEDPSLLIEENAPSSCAISKEQERPENETPMATEDPETALQHSTRPSSVDPQSYSHINRPLNVTDALSYLDAVKAQFHDQPDVYNHFLDIMKEFKNELIDTPGVIKRVSHLFHGHPSLIQGFNTFLPVGYRIECGIDAEDTNVITVTTPSGTVIQSTENIQHKDSLLWSSTQNSALPMSFVAGSSTVIGAGVGDDKTQPLEPASPDPRLYVADEQAMEPAVQYVQKIKQRCDPETYRQFLDILSQYHHKPGTMDEEEVSRQISRLFKDAPDLRSDFRVFMPERSQQLLDDDYDPKLEAQGSEGKSKRRTETIASATIGNGSSAHKRKRKTSEKDREGDLLRSAPASKKLKPYHRSGQEFTTLYSARAENGLSSHTRAHYQLVQGSMRAGPDNLDLQFFNSVKHALDNRETYNEFLKLINLFTQRFIDTTRLIKESRNYLGDTELLRQFQDMLGWDERKGKEPHRSTSEHGWTQPIIASLRDRPSHIDTNAQHGSYRKLPTSEVNVPCSGRDDMCRSVLNDDWVSHPTWASEDSGFVAHKKNMYEEALHRSEEERHEYDFHIEAITRTIATLEPINNKIAQLGMEERANYKLKPNLGGTLKSVHHRVIKKIYGREAGLEVIQAMQETPVMAIPVVLQRLKQKEDEWKRAQREWNKIWREVDARNYLKSLDHQAITFKTTDKKTLSTKALVNQLEAAREEQIAKRSSLIDPLFARTRPRHQLEYVIDDMDVLQDSLKLTLSFLDRAQAQINFADRRKIEGFMRIFVPLFFMLDSVSFNSAFVVLQETTESEMSGEDLQDDFEVSSIGSNGSRGGRGGRRGASSAASVNGAPGFNGGDLRKKLLKSEQAKVTGRKPRTQEVGTPSASRFASPVPDTADSIQVTNGIQSRRYSRRNNFFTNTTFYMVLRQLEILYSRLRLFKALSIKKANESVSRHSPTKAASQVDSQSANSNRPERFYELLLETCERLFDNEIEQHAFEDKIRGVFGIQDAYKIFTVDKVIGAIIKQVQAVFSDGKSQELLEILKKDRALSSPTTQDHLNSRRNAEKVLGPDENLFRIDWIPESKLMTIQLLGKDDSSFDDSEVLTGRWQSYIDSYISHNDTEGVSQARLRRPFLRRNIPQDLHEIEASVKAIPGIEIKLCVRTYRLFYVTNSEDIFWRKRTVETLTTTKCLQARNRMRQKWIEASLERKP